MLQNKVFITHNRHTSLFAVFFVSHEITPFDPFIVEGVEGPQLPLPGLRLFQTPGHLVQAVAADKVDLVALLEIAQLRVAGMEIDEDPILQGFAQIPAVSWGDPQEAVVFGVDFLGRADPFSGFGVETVDAPQQKGLFQIGEIFFDALVADIEGLARVV